MAQIPNKITAISDVVNEAQSMKLDTLQSTAQVKESADFQAMQAHIVNRYQGVEVQHSFVDANGSVFDCIPIEQQPALKGKGAPAAPPPVLPALTAARPLVEEDAEALKLLPADNRVTQQVTSMLDTGKTDALGNSLSAPAGTIPIRRITMGDLTKFQNLRQFFQKNPLGTQSAPPGAPGTHGVPATHRWAHATQSINNLGGHSFINAWDPSIGANQVFSLSQHWYVGGSTAGTQTCEVGLQVYPGKYGNTNPVFFIYWTADGYQNTGCYNLDCSNFVQTNKSWAIGGAVGPVSTYGGAQWELEIAVYLYERNWWIYVHGGAASDTIGYYPASQYGSGDMATHGTLIDYGGEVVGTTSFPGMGSSHFANQGWTKACYQREVQVYPQTGGAQNASLSPVQQWPNCYTAQVNLYNPSWSETLWYGGPGGNC
jgi:hypothetical protein